MPYSSGESLGRANSERSATRGTIDVAYFDLLRHFSSICDQCGLSTEELPNKMHALEGLSCRWEDHGYFPLTCVTIEVALCG